MRFDRRHRKATILVLHLRQYAAAALRDKPDLAADRRPLLSRSPRTNHHRQAAIQANRHRLVRLDPKLDQMMRQPAGVRIEFAIAQSLLVMDHRPLPAPFALGPRITRGYIARTKAASTFDLNPQAKYVRSSAGKMPIWPTACAASSITLCSKACKCWVMLPTC